MVRCPYCGYDDIGASRRFLYLSRMLLVVRLRLCRCLSCYRLFVARSSRSLA